MKITDYPSVQNLKENNVILLDGPDGTKSATVYDFSKSMVGDIILKTSDDYYDILDKVISPIQRRNTWRGKNLGSKVTDGQYDEIDAGTFSGIFLGDYWEIGERIWRVVDFDYWLGTGDPECKTHHLVIMPDHQLYEAPMNSSNTTTGAYIGSEMYTKSLTEAKTIVNGAFDAAHVLKHKEYLSTAVTNGYTSAAGWFDSTVELPNEPMMYGSYILTPGNNGTSIIPVLHTIDKSQLAGMMVNPTLIDPHRESQWLRDVVSGANFALVYATGYAARGSANNAYGVRVVFGICKKNTT